MDLRAAKTLYKHLTPRPLEIICYHTQQCAEKMLKGFLIANSISAPRTHDLPLLCDMCIVIDKRLSALSDVCDFLTLFGVGARYPNEIEILEEDATKAIVYAEQVVDFFVSGGIAAE